MSIMNSTTRLGEADSSTRSYLTEERLMRALDKLGFADHRKIVCQTVEGRWTAIFPFSNIQDGNVMRYAFHGFHTLG